MALSIQLTPLRALFLFVGALSINLHPLSLPVLVFALSTTWALVHLSIVPSIIEVVLTCWLIYDLEMDTQAFNLLALMQQRPSSVAPGIIAGGLSHLKADVKHKNVPLAAIAPLFDVVRLALDSTEYLDAGLSTLSHLAKRLVQQRQLPLLESQLRRTTPLVIDILTHEKERLRLRAAQAMVELRSMSNNVETMITAAGLETTLNDIISHVEPTASKHNPAPRSGVSHTQISASRPANSHQIAASRPKERAEEAVRTMQDTNSQEPPKTTPSTHSKPVQDPVVPPLPYIPEPSAAEIEAMKLDPIYVESAKDVDQIFTEMLPYFEGKEAESNWMQREQSALKIRRITRGNAPEEFLTHYTAGIKHILDGLVKGCTSLRTTLSTSTCHCVQDISRQLKQGLDPMVEVLLQCLLKLCANTKKLTAASGNACVAEMVSCVTFTARISQHLVNATKDKNVQPRLFATKWIMIVLTRYGRQRSHLDPHLEGLVTAISNGLNDRDKDVREAMRPTFWAFARLWNDRSKNILSKLDKKQQQLLLDDKTNPFPEDWFAAPSSAPNAPPKVSSARPSVKDAIAQQRALKKAPSDRPGSAADIAPPAKEVPAGMPARPKSAFSTSRRPALASSTGSMSSAPVRPLRPSKHSAFSKNLANELAAAGSTQALVDAWFPPRTPKGPRKAPIVPVSLTSRIANTPATGSTKAPNAVPVEPRLATPAIETTTKASPAGATASLSTTTQAKGSIRIPSAIAVDSSSASAPSDIFTQQTSDATVGTAATEVVMAIDPNARKRVSWSSDEMPLEFDKDQPPHDVRLASIRRSSSGSVDAPRRVPSGKDLMGPIGEKHPSNGNATHTETHRLMLRSPSDKSTATLPVEPSGLPANEAKQGSADTASSISTEQTSEYDVAKRLSRTPRPLASRKERLKTTFDGRAPLRVYEDDKDSVDMWLAIAMEELEANSPSRIDDSVLGELPINTDLPKRSNSFSAKTNTEDNVTIYRNRQLIERSITHILEGTFAEDGYRKLKSLISHDSTWANGDDGKARFDELVLSLQNVLRATGSYASKGFEQLHPLRSKVLQLLQILDERNGKDLDRWSTQIVHSLIIARNDYPNSTRIGASIKTLATKLAVNHAWEPTICCIMSQLGKGHELQNHSVYMALQVMAATLEKHVPKIEQDLEVELGALVTRCIGDLDADIRMGALDLAMVMFEIVKPASHYWQLMVGLDLEHHDLLVYYLAKRSPAVSKERQGSEELFY